MIQPLHFKMLSFGAVGDNGRFALPEYRDEWIEDLRRKRMLWSRLC